MAFAMEFSEEKQHQQRVRTNDPKLARLTAWVMGPQSVAFVEPADTVVPGLWDVFASDNRTYMGTFTTAELMTATALLLNRHSRHPWKPGQERKYGVPALHKPKKRRTRKGGRRRTANRAA